MLSRAGIILSLALALILSLGVPPKCQARPSKKTWSSKEIIPVTPRR
jgi:hypothetical protein